MPVIAENPEGYDEGLEGMEDGTTVQTKPFLFTKTHLSDCPPLLRTDPEDLQGVPGFTEAKA